MEEKLQAILEEAGLLHRQNKIETQVGADGKTIVVNDNYLTDHNNDNQVSADDVAVFVDGVPVEVDSVDPNNGVVTLRAAVDSTALVLISYNYSAVRLEYVDRVLAETMDELEAKIGCSELKSSHQDALRYIVRLTCAGKLLVRDYGFNQDIEGTSKDGYKKLELASERLDMLNRSVCGVGGGDGSSGLATPIAHGGDFIGQDEGDLFAHSRPRG